MSRCTLRAASEVTTGPPSTVHHTPGQPRAGSTVSRRVLYEDDVHRASSVRRETVRMNKILRPMNILKTTACLPPCRTDTKDSISGVFTWLCFPIIRHLPSGTRYPCSWNDARTKCIARRERAFQLHTRVLRNPTTSRSFFSRLENKSNSTAWAVRVDENLPLEKFDLENLGQGHDVQHTPWCHSMTTTWLPIW